MERAEPVVPMPQRTRWWRVPVAILLLAGLLALAWTAAVGWWLPRWLQSRIEQAGTAALGAPLTLQRIEIDPWRLQARVAGLRLGPAEAAWFQVAQVDAALSLRSVVQRAAVIDSLVVREPSLHVERLEPGRYNVTPLLQALAQQPDAPAGSEPARFVVRDVRLLDGRAAWVDRVGKRSHRIEGIQFAIPSLSSLPDDRALEVEARLDASVDGSPLRLQTRVRPFAAELPVALQIEASGLDIAHWADAAAPWLAQPLPLAVRRGRLDAVLQASYEHRAAPAPASLRIAGRLAFADLAAEMPSRKMRLSTGALVLDRIALHPLERRIELGRVQIQRPAVDLDLGALAGAGAPAAVAKPASAEADWHWRVASVEVDDGRVRMRADGWPEGQTLAGVRLRASALDAAVDAAPAPFALSASDARSARLRVDGTLGIAARLVTFDADLQGLDLVPWSAPWTTAMPVRGLGGTLTLQARGRAGASGWSIEQAAAQLTGLHLQPSRAVPRGASVEALRLPRADIDGVRVQAPDGVPSAVRIASVRLQGLALQASRELDGRIAWLNRPPATDGAKAGAPAAAVHWQLDELRCRGCAAELRDRAVAPEAVLSFAGLDLRTGKLGDDLRQPVAFELATQVGSAGRLRAQGTLRPRPLALRSRVDATGIELAGLQPYLDPYLNLTLVAARARADGELTLDGDASSAVAAARWRGALGLAELRALDSVNAADFLSLRSLGLEGAGLTWTPAALHADLGTVVLDGFTGRVIINADGRVNLRDIVKREAGEEARSLTTPSPAPSPAAPAEPSGMPQLRWTGVRVLDSEVDFTDLFIRPRYSARLTDLAGELSALAWDDPSPARLRLAGRVDGSAPLEIAGTLHPLGARLHTDIRASARGIDLTRLSSYAARYAGYGIDKGTMSVKVHYKVDGGKLEAENNLYLDQLSFGDAVESPDALKVPVLLAVALLKDRHGVIDIDLPISGSLDDPQFSIGGIVVRVIVNLITKAVTAPFALLARAFGGGGDLELGHVDFEPGSSDLGPAAVQRLDTLAKALDDRPGLRLEATGRADPVADAEALRRAGFERMLRVAKARAERVAPDAVEITSAERARWIEAAYREAPIEGRPRNRLGLLETLPTAEMEAALRRSVVVGPEQLKELADERSDRVKAYLTNRVAPERVLLTVSRSDAEGLGDKGRPSRVSFELK